MGERWPEPKLVVLLAMLGRPREELLSEPLRKLYDETDDRDE
jgi:hypothetical protein